MNGRVRMKQRFSFSKDEIKEMRGNCDRTVEEVLEDRAYRMFDLRHRADIVLCRVGKTFFEIEEVE